MDMLRMRNTFAAYEVLTEGILSIIDTLSLVTSHYSCTVFYSLGAT
jgi:hypothetical protein